MRLYLPIIALAVALCTWAGTLEWNQHGDVMQPPLPREVLWQVYASATTMPVEDADAEEDAESIQQEPGESGQARDAREDICNFPTAGD